MNRDELEQVLKTRIQNAESLMKTQSLPYDYDKVRELASVVERLIIDAIESGKIKQLAGVKNTTKRIAAFKLLDGVIKGLKTDPSKIAVALLIVREVIDLILEFIGAEKSDSTQAIESNSSARS